MGDLILALHPRNQLRQFLAGVLALVHVSGLLDLDRLVLAEVLGAAVLDTDILVCPKR